MTSRGPIARRGAIVVWVVVLGVVLIGLVGLAMDAGIVFLAGSQLQIAADAGSLAGARLVREDDLNMARQAAYDIAHENKAAGNLIDLDLNSGNAADGDIVIGHFYRFADDYNDPPNCPNPPCFFPGESPNAVRVRARRTSTSIDDQVPLVFGAVPLFNVVGIDVTRSATAIIAGGTGAGLIALCPDCECALDLRGTTDLVLQTAPGYDGDAAIQINSEDPCALCANGNSELTAPETNIVAVDPGYCFNGNPPVDTFINPGSPAMPDPLAGLGAPSVGTDLGEIRAAGYYPPGYYSGGLDISGNEGIVVELGPGIYVLGSLGNEGALQINGTAGLNAHNVMLYIKSGKVDLNGTGDTTITPMTEEINTDPYYIGISIFQARDNFTEARIIGTADMDLQGTYYFPKNKLEVGGIGIALGNQLITWELYLHGTGVFAIQYDGRFPAPGSKVFLVE